jgi:hypothetical protein
VRQGKARNTRKARKVRKPRTKALSNVAPGPRVFRSHCLKAGMIRIRLMDERVCSPRGIQRPMHQSRYWILRREGWGESKHGNRMTTDSQGFPVRFRLRFLLQEFDLPTGTTLIGRGDDCHITIFDPSISRQHARIVVDDERAFIEDVGSRNGCRVNGIHVKEATELGDGDRIRIGTQELVLSEVRATSQVVHRQTGSLCYCGSCRAAYAREMDSCPHCGSTLRGTNPLASDETDEVSIPHFNRRAASGPP